jgi:hypothetical protein
MSPGRIQLFLFLGICAMTLHFSIRLGVESSRYFALSAQARARISQWEIAEIKNKFALKANYHFEVKEKNWIGVSTLLPPYYLNEFAALAALKEKAKKEWMVWHNPKNPQISALEKGFPTGLLVRSLICYGVIIYFFCLYKKLARV